MKAALRKLTYPLRGPVGAIHGLWDYYTKGKISDRAWNLLLDAHVRTNGRFTDRLIPIVGLLRRARTSKTRNGILGKFTVEQQDSIVRTLHRDGYYVFDRILSDALCETIATYARTAPARIEDKSAPLIVYDPGHPVSRTYKIPEAAAVKNDAIQTVMADEVFLAIASHYLNTQASLGGVDLWWSAAYGDAPGDDAAQTYHFDFDAPPAWLKLFIYVNDAGPEQGPHMFMRGTHKAGIRNAATLLRRGYVRISDEDIHAAFGTDAEVEISGRRGTVFLVDTRAFHKGKMPTAGDRLALQLLYCSPIFCSHGAHVPLPQPGPALAGAMASCRSAYRRYE